MASARKTNSFGTFLETIEQAAPPSEAPAALQPGGAHPLTDVSRRVLQLLATGAATSTQIREQVGAEADDVLAELGANGFVEKLPGRTDRYGLTTQGQAVVQLLRT
jgi:hypothetical protein